MWSGCGGAPQDVGRTQGKAVDRGCPTELGQVMVAQQCHGVSCPSKGSLLSAMRGSRTQTCSYPQGVPIQQARQAPRGQQEIAKGWRAEGG